ncbi:toll/interleukin-1 receptor domain-containing protein [Ulvibacter antarcticus]|uniref:TIR domain-containing protein n=1 Tax=Ulvibacter antarcticus TaxID=442714 RepID=A0A3L9ZCE9_9FLAO|nr:toll/interleukin-1 receptor domain-containing protein [Ulvibacter antarcticus]RMA64312.1 TIR domain-containing protein [Ulvibacter antarcticus]
MQKSNKKPSVYISYAWNDESNKIVDSIEKKFTGKRVNIIRDKKDLPFKGRIKEFMEELGRGKYVIVIISNKFLRSENCMFELLQIFKNDDFYERIFPLVLDEVKIAKAADRLELVKYWENEATVLDTKIRDLKELSNIQGVADDLNLYSEIRNNIARLTNILKDINSLNIDKHISSDFQQLYLSLENTIKLDSAGETNTILNRSLYAVVGVIALFMVYYFFPSEKLEQRSPVNDISTETSSDEEVYTVMLKVAHNMKDGEVYVDNEPATIVKRENEHIFVRLQKKNTPYSFEVKNNKGNCKAAQIIEKDTTELVMSCKENIVSVQYYTVKLKMETFMTDGEVYVDNKPATIVNRGETYVTVRVKKKNGSHYFEVRNEIGFCEAQETIEKDATELLMKC